MYYNHKRLPRKLKKVLKNKYPQLFCMNHEFYREFLDLNQKLWYVLSIEKPLLHQKIMNEIIKDNGFNNSLNRVSKIMVKNDYKELDIQTKERNERLVNKILKASEIISEKRISTANYIDVTNLVNNELFCEYVKEVMMVVNQTINNK